jgi:hypothetical protein
MNAPYPDIQGLRPCERLSRGDGAARRPPATAARRGPKRHDLVRIGERKREGVGGTTRHRPVHADRPQIEAAA